MLFVLLLLAVLVITVCAAIIRWIFNPRWKFLNWVIIIGTAIAIVFGLFYVGMSGYWHNSIENLHDDYHLLMLYYDVINNCDNEYVRFDFYQRISDYNTEYLKHYNNTTSAWGEAFYPNEWYNEFSQIHFELREG